MRLNRLKKTAIAGSMLLYNLLTPMSAFAAATELKDHARFDSYITQSAQQHSIEPELLKAIIRAESNFNENAVSSSGAVGLGQIKPETGRSECGLEEKELHEPQKNIECAADYFSSLVGRFDNYMKALAAYNAGPGSKSTNQGVYYQLETKGDDWFAAMPAKTREYVSRVNDYYYLYKTTGVDSEKGITVTRRNNGPANNPVGNAGKIESGNKFELGSELGNENTGAGTGAAIGSGLRGLNSESEASEEIYLLEEFHTTG